MSRNGRNEMIEKFWHFINKDLYRSQHTNKKLKKLIVYVYFLNVFACQLALFFIQHMKIYGR